MDRDENRNIKFLGEIGPFSMPCNADFAVFWLQLIILLGSFGNALLVYSSCCTIWMYLGCVVYVFGLLFELYSKRGSTWDDKSTRDRVCRIEEVSHSTINNSFN